MANIGGYGYLYEVDDTGIPAGNLFLNNRYGIAMLATSNQHNPAVCNNVTYGSSADTNYSAPSEEVPGRPAS